MSDDDSVKEEVNLVNKKWTQWRQEGSSSGKSVTKGYNVDILQTLKASYVIFKFIALCTQCIWCKRYCKGFCFKAYCKDIVYLIENYCKNEEKVLDPTVRRVKQESILYGSPCYYES